MENPMICPITHIVMKDPVITENGFTFEREAIAKCRTCPLTRYKYKKYPLNLIPNLAVKAMIESANHKKRKYLDDVSEEAPAKSLVVVHTIHWPNGDKYVGKLHAGLPHGHGTMWFADGRRYKGSWKEGQWHGEGTLYVTNKDNEDIYDKTVESSEGDNVKEDDLCTFSKKKTDCMFSVYELYVRCVLIWFDNYKAIMHGTWDMGNLTGDAFVFKYNEEIGSSSMYAGHILDELPHGPGVKVVFDFNDQDEDTKNIMNQQGSWIHGLLDGPDVIIKYTHSIHKIYKSFMRSRFPVYSIRYGLSDGSGWHYIGGIERGKPHGNGVLSSFHTVHPLGFGKFEGPWMQGRPGTGFCDIDFSTMHSRVYYAEDLVHFGDHYTIKYKGSILNGLKHGHGHLFADDEMYGYKGEFEHDLKHGHGTSTWVDGSVFEGVWKNNLFVEGRGKFPNGDTYEGEWKAYKPHGKGTYTCAVDGEVYTGDFLSGERHGQGVCRTASGDEYVGGWRVGLKHGPGHLNGDPQTWVGGVQLN
jgi:hypothetical protein